MGRNARGILEYAKTITWFDYLFNEAKKLKHLNITNDYKFYKFMYSNSKHSPEDKLFKNINLVYLHLKNHGKKALRKIYPVQPVLFNTLFGILKTQNLHQIKL